MVASERPPLPGGPWSGVALGRATLATCALLLAVAAGAWIHVVLGMRAHGHEAMAGMSTMSLRDGIAYVASWVVMMAA